MEIIRGIHNLKSHHYGCVLTIGNFDGFHRGHQAIIARLVTEGLYYNLPKMVIIFEPQPQEYFISHTTPSRLTRLRDKIKYLNSAGIDIVLCITFNKYFANINAKKFIIKLLVQKLGIKSLIIGNDFRFGKCRQGNLTLLKKIGHLFKFNVINIERIYTEKGTRISSTAIRIALNKNKLLDAEILLGHSYRLSGRVEYGEALGRNIIGVPTANISLKKYPSPINGVYVVEVNGITNKALPGVAHIGIRPTVNGLYQRLEVHLLDINLNLYGKHIEVIILNNIRNEKKFSSLLKLKEQIMIDIITARNYFIKKNV